MKIKLRWNLFYMIFFPKKLLGNTFRRKLGKQCFLTYFFIYSFSWFFISPLTFGNDINIIWWWNLIQISCEVLQEDLILSQRNVKFSDRFYYTTKTQIFIEYLPMKGENCTKWLSLFTISIISLNILQQQVQRNEAFFSVVEDDCEQISE